MKALTKVSLIAALLFSMATPSFTAKSTQEAAAAGIITTTATGYTKAEDVKYDRSGNYKDDSGDYIANWGARGEDCVFLSMYAQSFYTGSYTYETLSAKNGGSSQSNAPQSALYSALKSMMTKEHTHITSYQETRYMYRYTDCVSNNSDKISSFYSGKVLNGTWDSAATWNREHTWPNSKGLGGQDENDIMMLRPTWVSENSSRGNTAYGESSDYFDPGESVRGDCARIVLYVYVRWGNTSNMWGKSGVMENMNILLEWMEEDPVDTWEMGRNDVVEDITGTRNVFVDYPEYAWLLFGREIPEDMSTPSGIANGETPGGGSTVTPDPDPTPDPKPTPDPDPDASDREPTPDSSEDDNGHKYSEWFVAKQPTATEEGERIRTCVKCGDTLIESIPKLTDTEGDPNENSSEEGGLLGCGGALEGSFAGVILLAAVCVFLSKNRKISPSK